MARSRVWKLLAKDLPDSDGSGVASADGVPVVSADGETTVFVALGDLLDALQVERKNIGGWSTTLAADQTGDPIERGTVDLWVAPRAGFITGISAALSAALTDAGGDDQTVTLKVSVAGGAASAALLTFTAGGAATASATLMPIAVAAGDTVELVYDSDTITNTPTIDVDLEITE